MSNFETLALITEGNISTAPQEFSASTVDSYATITAAGYLNDIGHKIKANDIFYINYADLSTYPLRTGESATLTQMKVTYNPATLNWSLVPPAFNQNGVNLLATLGFHSSSASSTTTSATSVYNDAQISPSAIAFARWPIAATAGYVYQVQPGNGTLTIVNSSTAGVSTIDYFTVIGSATLENLGVHVSQYSNAGGSATIVILDPVITTASVVIANFLSATSNVKIETIVPTAGKITILCSGDPGVSVISYLSVIPSTQLTTDGLYATVGTSAGGSATVTITDANITATSIVMANMVTQTNASYIEKVTASASTLTILLNTDAGAATFAYIATATAENAAPSTYLLAANNLSDVASTSTALTNLGALPVAGGTLTGKVNFLEGTGSGATPTVSKQAGVVTTASLSTAAASAATATTITNTLVTSTSTILVSLMGGTNTTGGVQISAVPTSNTITVTVYNNNVAGTALNGTLIIGFVVLN